MKKSSKATSAGIAKRMKNLKKWPKGVSGNPAGRKKSIPKLEDELTELLGGTSHDGSDSGMRKVLQNIFHEATKRGNPNAVRAASMLVERVYGKEPVIIKGNADITSGGEKISSGIDISKLSTQAIKEIINALTKPQEEK